MKLITRIGAIIGLLLALLSLGNSAYAHPAQYANAADLTVWSVKHYILNNGQEWLYITLKNQGTANAGQFKVNISGWGGTNTNSTFWAVNGLAAGATLSFSYNTGFTTSCDFERTFKVDSDNAIYESNETNNGTTVYDAFCPRPDIKITMTRMNQGTGPGEYQRITVKNVGTAAAGAFQIAVTSWGGANTGITKSLSGLPVNGSYSFDFYPRAVCDYGVKATADSGNVVNEFNEANNVATGSDGCLK